MVARVQELVVDVAGGLAITPAEGVYHVKDAGLTGMWREKLDVVYRDRAPPVGIGDEFFDFVGQLVEVIPHKSAQGVSSTGLNRPASTFDPAAHPTC